MHGLFTGALLFIAVLTTVPADAAETKLLFDGATLTGWEGDTEQTWRVEGGAILAGSLDRVVPRNEFLCTTHTYGDFKLKVTLKLLGHRSQANAGIQFRTSRLPKHHDVSGYQADVGQHYWGALYDESRRNRILAQPDRSDIARLIKHEDWNDYTIRCEGPRIRLWLNGTLTVDYREQDAKIERAGIICLQIHGGAKAKVYYKHITIEELTK